MAFGSLVLCSRPVPSASLGKKQITSEGRGFKACLVPALMRVQRKNPRCAYSGGCSEIDVQVPVRTLYELLGISQQVGLPEIKTAYREMARRYHPDVNPPSKRDECTKHFLLVQEAYEVLADPDSRADYDYQLKNPMSVQALASGFASGKSRRSSRREEVVDKEAWRAQWEAQVDGLKSGFTRKKAGSWSARLQRKREEEAASRQ